MKKKFLLFDVDRTLLDFQKSEQIAIKETLLRHSFAYSEEIRARYEAINEYYWGEFEKGTIQKSEILYRRFEDLFSEYGFLGDAVQFDIDYRNELARHAPLIEGAMELVDKLKKQGYFIYYVTNGTKEVQWPRLKASDLDKLADGIFISEEIGFQKPDAKYFEIVFSKIPNFTKEEAIIIGDSLTSDIKGGVTMGIDTCWYRPDGSINTMNLPITYEISKLNELEQILNAM